MTKGDKRPEQEIFAEIAQLCRSPGYAHAVASICFDDAFLTFKKNIGEVSDDRPSSEKLIRSEISVLIGLLIQGPLDLELITPSTLDQFKKRTYALMDELHSSMSGKAFRNLDLEKIKDGSFDPFGTGEVLREPIMYGGDSAYTFQYRDIAPEKYSYDAPWLEQHKGFTVQTARDVCMAIRNFQAQKLGYVATCRAENPDKSPPLLWGFLLNSEELAVTSGMDAAVIDRVLTAFAIPAGEHNAGFVSVSDFNIVSKYPLLRTDEREYICFQPYGLYEALYDVPFYWMCEDDDYIDQALTHRGYFAEDFSSKRLASVFGASHVFKNVFLLEGKKTVGEIDVLVLFGNRAIVVQAKSKRLTLAAKKGNDEKIKDDFKKAIQDAYDQGFFCAGMLLDPKFRCETGGTIVPIPKIKEVYIFCVVSDHYPALTIQSRQFLKYQQTPTIQPPFIMDVFTLDVMAEMLQSPLRFLSYVNRRVNYSERVMADQELTILGHHLKQSLWVDDEYTMLYLTEGLAYDLDIAMVVRREGVEGPDTPKGILTEVPKTAIGRIIRQIEAQPDAAPIDVGLFLLTLGANGVTSLSEAIDRVVKQTQETGGSHDAGGPVGNAGLTVHCNDDDDERAGRRLLDHCKLRKYSVRASKWYGLSLRSSGHIRCALSADFEWKYDEALANAVIALLPNKGLPPSTKLGRNDPCPCGSGKKYKKCHLGKPLIH